MRRPEALQRDFQLQKIGRTAYWNSRPGRVASPALGDASRGASYLALRPAVSNGEKPVATTPRAAGFSSQDSLGSCDRRLAAAAVDRDVECERLLLDPVLVREQLGLGLRQGQHDAVGQLEALLLAQAVHLVDQIS